ncbi:PTS cellobiose transporter subunit IIC [Lonepinella koalarum]|nr:PTS cellobiose transporter subunit IIC [Lonepinella koalarum]TFJ91194.1 PTS cellobiose transporter subunit IIC [Lonepinella koalarum]TYG35607.1 PTS cellobiose transporter subunit IIC [Lonepinella koalarum]
MFQLLEKYLMGPMAKIAAFKSVRAIMAAGIASITFTIVGSLFLVFNVLPTTFTFLQDFFNDTFFRISDLYLLVYKASMGILAIYFVIVISYEYTKIHQQEDELNVSPLNGALLAVFAFFLCVPELLFVDGKMQLLAASKTLNGWTIGGNGPDRLGTVGIFTAIIMALLSVKIYCFCVKRNFVIKMPEAVPEGVARSFTALIPAFAVALVVLVINGTFVLLGTDIFKVIAIPFAFVTDIANSWLGLMVILFLIHALWIVGIHGASLIMAFVKPILLINLQANINGEVVPYAGEFNNSFVLLGGSGATLGLTLFIAFLARSQQLRILGKASVAPGIFNINEPIIFGLPIVYNPYLAIPFFFAPMVSASLAYWAIKLEWINPIIAYIPWPSPAGIGAFIGTAGDWRASILALLCAVVAWLIYLPFIRMYDNKLYKEEQVAVQA